MALTIDSNAVLRAIADYPEAFPAVQPDLDELARKLLGKQIKSKFTDVVLLHKIVQATGEKNLLGLLDNYAENELSALMKKIDPHAKEQGDLATTRAHIVNIAAQRTLPSGKPEKATKVKVTRPPSNKPSSKIGNILESKVHSGKTAVRRVKKT